MQHRLEQLSSAIAWSQGQDELLELIILQLVSGLQISEAPTLRSKTLRTLGLIVDQDSRIFARVS